MRSNFYRVVIVCVFLALAAPLAILYSNSLLSVTPPMPQATSHEWIINLQVLSEPRYEFLSKSRSSVLVCVTSAPANIRKRLAIRQTWGSATSNDIRVVFLMGVPTQKTTTDEQLTLERERHGDIVVVNFTESYRNLTVKSVALILWAARTRWPERRFVVKADDDTFINTPLLLKNLDDFRDGEIYGEYRERSKVLRCKRSACNKWGLTTDEFSPDVFPPHLQGAFYVITEQALDRLHDHIFEPNYIFIEDVYITGLVAGRAGISPRPLPKGLISNPYWPRKDTLAALNTKLVAQHRCDPNKQMKYWKYILTNRTSSSQ